MLPLGVRRGFREEVTLELHHEGQRDWGEHSRQSQRILQKCTIDILEEENLFRGYWQGPCVVTTYVLSETNYNNFDYVSIFDNDSVGILKCFMNKKYMDE